MVTSSFGLTKWFYTTVTIVRRCRAWGCLVGLFTVPGAEKMEARRNKLDTHGHRGRLTVSSRPLDA